jgi:hypothetical protein
VLRSVQCYITPGCAFKGDSVFVDKRVRTLYGDIVSSSVGKTEIATRDIRFITKMRTYSIKII